MAERGQRVALRIGGVEADVSLLKTSGKPAEAQHETRRVGAETARGTPASSSPALSEAGDLPRPSRDPFEDEAPAPAPARPDPRGDVEQGVHDEAGEWHDLTAELAAVDERTRLDGMELVGTVALTSVVHERVRDARYVAPAGEGAPKVLGLLWAALRGAEVGGVVRWTKRTNQALGLLVARGGVRGTRRLVLVELEWAQNMRPIPSRARLDAAVEAATAGELQAAAGLVEAYRSKPDLLAHLRDERAAQRAELLEAARAGRRLPAPPTVEPEPDARAFAEIFVGGER